MRSAGKAGQRSHIVNPFILKRHHAWHQVGRGLEKMDPQALQSMARQAIGQGLRRFTGSKSSMDAFAAPSGDPGLFGPTSVAWRVHAHFTAMMVGGLSSLMVQALHPRALAVVWDHSDFRTSLKDRLGATAYFVAATTYGSEAMAMRAIERVNTIHANVRGVDLKGQPYVANEPVLIRWVHLVEVISFVEAYQLLADTPLTSHQVDQYIQEMTRVGHLLGAVDLPTTYCGTQEALSGFKGQLEYNERTRLILQTIRSYPAEIWEQPFIQLMLKSAGHILPAWALDVLGESQACALDIHLTRAALKLMSTPIQWALDQDGVAAVSRQRAMHVPAHTTV
jgi:uncharacterized protein (DUF2236 family)